MVSGRKRKPLSPLRLGGEYSFTFHRK